MQTRSINSPIELKARRESGQTDNQTDGNPGRNPRSPTHARLGLRAVGRRKLVGSTSRNQAGSRPRPPATLPVKQFSFIKSHFSSEGIKPRRFCNDFLPHFKRTRFRGPITQPAAPVASTALISLVSGGDRNPTGIREHYIASFTLPSQLPPNHPRLCRPHRNNGRTNSMHIEEFFNLCDRILRKTAEQNPEALCLQNIPDDRKQCPTDSQTEAN